MTQFYPIHYFSEEVDFNLIEPELTASWVQEVIHQEGYQLIGINFIFCSDQALHAKNLQYLQHDTWTDIITFDYADIPNQIEGDIYISIERVQENTYLYTHNFWQELYTVMIHGVLHLLGYGDHEEQEKATMRAKEAFYVKQRLSKASFKL
jgi:probable rRNA maturation factor